MKKKLLLFASSLLITIICFSQQVPRNLVVLEIGTGTWCQFCPAASNGADELLDNGYSVAVIKYHSGDEFANVYSNARVSYYGISGFPTAYFDGLNPVVGGGGASQTMFAQYSARVNQRMAIQSAFTLEVEGSHACMTDFTANVTVTKVGTNNSTSLRLHAVLTEKNIPRNWQGLNKVNHACRLMVPNQNGTIVSFAGGNTQEFSLPFTVNPAWVFENLELVIFLQDHNTKEILQADKLYLSDFLPEYEFDMGVSKIDGLPTATCNGLFEPSVTIRNYGSEVITAVDIVYNVNSGSPATYSWTGSLAYMEEENVTLPAIDFDVDEDNVLVVSTSNPNGIEDECPVNDEMAITIPKAMNTPLTVRLFLRLDTKPEETTWELLDPDGEVLFSGGPYTVPGQTIQQIFELDDPGCHTFNIYDSGGDGLSSPGILMLFYGSNIIIYQGREFGYSKSIEFNAEDVTGVPDLAGKGHIGFYPNPVSEAGTVELNLIKDSRVEIQIMNLAGSIVKQFEGKHYQAGINHIELDLNAIAPGIYIMKAKIDTDVLWHKISIVR